MKISLSFDNVASEKDERIVVFLKCLIDGILDSFNDLDSLEEEED